MREFIKRVIRSVIINSVELGFTEPLVFIVSKSFVEVRPKDGSVTLDKPTILAFTPVRFRGDLEILADSKEFRVLTIPEKWQIRLLGFFWDKVEINKYEYYNPEEDLAIIETQKRLRNFLQIFLLNLYERLRIDCVISCGPHIIHDYDWGLVSNKIGVPLIILNRENLYFNKVHKEFIYNRFKKFKKFWGSHIIVHNNIVKEAIIRSKFENPENVSVLGCLRMDKLVKMAKISPVKLVSKRPKATLFSFAHGTGLYPLGIPNFSKNRDVGFVKLYEHVHLSFARLAMQNKDVDFVIKLKLGGYVLDNLEYLFKKNNIELANIENLSVSANVDVHALIVESDIICAFQSTTILESAIFADKHIIIPYFDEALKPEFNEYIKLKDFFYLFDIAKSQNEFEDLIIRRLRDSNSGIDNELLAKRRSIFDEYVSPIEGNALEKYVKVINQVINKSKSVSNMTTCN